MSQGVPYPIFLQLTQRPVLVVGGGAVGLRKTRGLVEAGAQVTVVSLAFHEGFVELPGVVKAVGGYQKTMITEGGGGRRWVLVFAATNDPGVNEQVQHDAAVAGIFVCRCDEAEAGDFWGGATLQQPGLTLAISTQGGSPHLGQRIREQALAGIENVLLEWSQLLKQWRGRVHTQVQDPTRRRQLLLRLAGDEMERCLRQKGKEQAQVTFEQWLAEACADTREQPHA